MHAWLIAALVVSWALVAALAGLLFVLVKQHGQLIMYQQDLDHRLEISSFFEGKKAAYEASPEGMEAQGLPVGTEAPSFALPDLDGTERRLEDFRGEPVVLAFFSTTCGYCLNMAPALGELSRKKKSHRLVLVSHGEVDAHRQILAENDLQADVLLEPEWDVMVSYQAAGTPSGYLIDSEGRIASGIAVGGDPVLALLEAQPAEPSENGHVDGNGHVDPLALRASAPSAPEGSDEQSSSAVATATALKTRDVAESNLVRDGLPAGTIAPNFVLTDLAGKAHSLVDYRGKRVLLVFSDVTCGPCEAVSPGLVELQERRAKKLQVIMISRGDEQENRRKAEAFGYPFPVLRQRSWEISKLYGMFATPIAYLIDEDGVIAKEVAVGPEPILDLV